jgi:hypothetical protein
MRANERKTVSSVNLTRFVPAVLVLCMAYAGMAAAQDAAVAGPASNNTNSALVSINVDP